MYYVVVGVVAQDKTFGQPYKICSAINNSAVNRLFYLRTCRLAELVERGSNFYWRGNLPAVCMSTARSLGLGTNYCIAEQTQVCVKSLRARRQRCFSVLSSVSSSSYRSSSSYWSVVLPRPRRTYPSSASPSTPRQTFRTR